MKSKSFYYTLSFASGVALPLAFAPFRLYPLAIISLSLLLSSYLHAHKNLKQTFILGWLFGFGFFGVGVSWVYISIYTYGHATLLVAASITFAFIAFLALFPALNGYLLNKLCKENSLAKIIFVFPASWVLFEWIRSWLFTGFPWLFLGTSQISSPLKNLAPIVGVFGVSFAVVFLSAAPIAFFKTKKITHKMAIISAALLLIFISIALKSFSWVTPKGEKLRVSLIQGNVPLEEKWDPAYALFILKKYYQLTAENIKSDLIVWPEAAIPALQWQAQSFLKKVSTLAQKNHTTVITGILYQPKDNKKYYNAMMALGKEESLYLKKHLVPFGEFLPLKNIFSKILQGLNIPWSDLTRGPKKQTPFIANGFYIAPFLCYEIAYPHMALEYLPHAQFLLTISEDSWFGHSTASAQQFEMAQMRSLEVGRWQIVCANSGITGIIDAQGNVFAKAPAFQTVVLNGEIEIMTGLTPYTQYGHYLLIILVSSCFLGGVLFSWRGKKKLS